MLLAGHDSARIRRRFGACGRWYLVALTRGMVFESARRSAPAVLLLTPSLAFALRVSLRLIWPLLRPWSLLAQKIRLERIFAKPRPGVRHKEVPNKEKCPKEKAPDDLPLVCDEGFPALLGVFGARELPPFGRSDMHAFASENPCDARRRQRDWGASCRLGGYPQDRHDRLRSPRDPRWCSRAPQVQNGQARGLSDRAQRGSSAAPVLCRGAQGSRSEAETKPSGCPFLCLLSFGQAKERRAGALRRAHPKQPRAKREQTPRFCRRWYATAGDTAHSGQLPPAAAARKVPHP